MLFPVRNRFYKADLYHNLGLVGHILWFIEYWNIYRCILYFLVWLAVFFYFTCVSEQGGASALAGWENLLGLMFSRCLFYFVVVCLCFLCFNIIYFSFTFLRYILISIYSDIDQPSLFSIKYISNKPCLHKIRFSGKIYIVPEIIDLRKLKEYIGFF